MIYLERTITIANSSASIDEPIILYKGDRNVEIQFVLKNSPFRYKSSTNPTYGQLIINRENADSIFSDVSETVKGKILFVITGDMIDELNECGNYDFQIRLFNEDKTSRVTLMPIIAGITIREPICEGDEERTVGYYEGLYNLKTDYGTLLTGFFYRYPKQTIDLSNFDTSQAISMNYMFYYAEQLKTIIGLENFDTSKVTMMNHMFAECNQLTSIDVSNFNTGNVTNMGSMFYNCRNLTSLDVSNWDTSNVTSMIYMFNDCESLTSLDLSNWDVSKVTTMSYMFYNCKSLTELDLSSWDISKITSTIAFSSVFYDCVSLVDFRAPKNINVPFYVSYCSLLTHDSLMSIINNLMPQTSTITLTLGETNLAKLTDEEKAIATNKGWTLK